MAADPSSFANSGDVSVQHALLDLSVDFEKRQLRGFAELTVAAAADGVSIVILDTRDLLIERIDAIDGAELKYSLGERHAAFGSALLVHVPQPLAAGAEFKFRVHYATSPASSAIQWMEPSQTAGKQHPYMFTQCQAIHARALLPCQDTPGVKATYAANIRVAAPLVALMSALRVGQGAADEGHTITQFRQPVPVPSYLIAMAVGNLESRDIGPRSKVWSEPEMVQTGAYVFSETEQFLSTAEAFLPPYAWGRYDLLLLPPSFPYGGMENPTLTFVTPTVLAEDRSLTNVVAHEIAHSWSGNLVTNRDWRSFWLNEGMTVLIERKIIGRLFGQQVFDLSALLGWGELDKSVHEQGAEHTFTSLTPNLDGVDPDDSYSIVPYEKGFFFLLYLQNVVGGAEPFEAFMRAYFTHFARKTVTSQEFRAFFLTHFADCPAVAEIDWTTWLEKPGMPPVKPALDDTLAVQARELAAIWKAGGEFAESAQHDISGWQTIQKLVLLDELLVEPLPSLAVIDKMEATYQFSASTNAEIRFRWQTLCLRRGRLSVVDDVVKFLAEQGRMKFTRPLYRELAKVQPALARETFARLRSMYHNICAKMVARDLGME